MNNKIAIIVGFAVIYLVWGSTYLAIKYAIDTLPPFLMMGVRFWIAGVILYAWMVYKGHGRVTTGEWTSATIMAITMIALGTGVVAWVEEYLPSGLTCLLLSVSPIWMVFIEALIPGGHKPGIAAFSGIMCGLVGVFVLVGPQSPGSEMPWIPMLVLLVSSFFWSIGSLYARHQKNGGNPLKMTSLQMILGGLMLLIMGMVKGEGAHLAGATISMTSIGALVYLITFGSLLVFPTYVWLMKKTGPGLVGTHAYVNPVVALFLGWLFAGEVINLAVIIASVLILASIVLLAIDNRRVSPQRKPRLFFRRKPA